MYLPIVVESHRLFGVGGVHPGKVDWSWNVVEVDVTKDPGVLGLRVGVWYNLPLGHDPSQTLNRCVMVKH